MASSSKKSAAKANLLGQRKPEDGLKTKPILKENSDGLGKREPEDDLETKPILKKHKDISEEKEVALRKNTLFFKHLSRQTEISHIINFFNYAGKVVRVQLILNPNGHGEHAGYGFVEFASAQEAKKALEKKNGEYLHDRKIFLYVAKTAPRHKYCIDHKVVWYEDYLQRESLLIEEDETVKGLVEEFAARKKTLFVAHLSPQTKISHIYDFFYYVGKVVSVRLIVNHEGKHVGCGFVEFATANLAKKVLEEKNGEYLHDHKIFLDVAKIAPYPPRAKYNLAEKLWYEDYLLRESLLLEEDETVEGLDENPDFVEVPVLIVFKICQAQKKRLAFNNRTVATKMTYSGDESSDEEIAVRKKTLFVANLSPQTEISHIINFFNYAGKVVRVQLILKRKDNGVHADSGFVEFAFANEAKKALQKKNGEYLHDCKIFLDVANKGATYFPPKYCIDHKVWYEDYLRRESLLIEEDETVEGLVEEVALRKKTLFVANLPPQIKISHVKNLFQCIGLVYSVRLIVNHEGKHVGCGFVEFATANIVKQALQRKNGEEKDGHKIFVDVAEIAPYPLRPKYNVAEKLWYEDYLRREEEVNKPIRFCGKKTTFVDDEEAFCSTKEAFC